MQDKGMKAVSDDARSMEKYFFYTYELLSKTQRPNNEQADNILPVAPNYPLRYDVLSGHLLLVPVTRTSKS